MLIKNQNKNLKQLVILTGVILPVFILCSLGINLNRACAQTDISQDKKARQFAEDMAKDRARLKEESFKKLTLEVQNLRKYNEQLELKSKELYLKLEDLKEQIRDKESLDVAFKKANADCVLLKQQKHDLLNEIDEISRMFQSKEARLYEQQAVSYVKAKAYDLAITAFENSLKLNPDNAQAHYTVSLLYQQVYQDKKKAVAHMKEYLRLTPQAKNKSEAQYIADMLSGDLYDTGGVLEWKKE